MPDMPAVYVEGISKSYGNFRALDNVSLSIRQGEIFGLIGPNGAGKTTLAKIASGSLKPDSGNVFILGMELGKNYKEIKKNIAIVPQEISCFFDFTVEENIWFFASFYGISGKELRQRVEYLLNWLDLAKFRERKAKDLSGGYKRLLNIACSLVNDPKVIFMDEPTVGLDPKVRQVFWDKILALKEQGKTVCLTTHYMDEAQHLCSDIGLISGGKLLTTGTPFDLVQKFGGLKVLVVKLSRQPESEDVDAMKEALQESEIVAVGNFLIISLLPEKALEKISVITEWLVEQGYEIMSSQLKEPDLEDVFMTVAGERLKE